MTIRMKPGIYLTIAAFLLLLAGTWQCQKNEEEEPEPFYADFSVQGGSVQAQVPVTFIDASVGAKTWAWNFGNGNTSNSKTPPAQTYPSEGTYTVSLTVTNGAGASDTKTINLSVGPQPDVLAQFSMPAYARKNEQVSFTNNSLFASVYQWDFGAGVQASTEKDPVRSFPTTGARTVTLTASNSKGSDTETKTLEICDTPVAAFTTSNNDANTFLSNAYIAFSSTSTLNASDAVTTYYWDFGNGQTSNQEKPTYAYPQGGTYTVKLKISNPCGEDWSNNRTLTITESPVMKSIPTGKFPMGCNPDYDPNCLDDEMPTRSVTLNTYQISEAEVTQVQWQTLMGSNPSNFSCPQCPVEMVSWYDAVVYCNRLSEAVGLEPCYYSNTSFTSVYGKNGSDWTLPNSGTVYWKTSATGYRLPTEAEWERAARDGVTNKIYSGGNDINAAAWYESNSGNQTHAVKQKPAYGTPNYQLYDMSGNVYEWCFDWYDTYPSGSQTNPTGPASGSNRVVRGGSWNTPSTYCRVAHRGALPPYGYRNDAGFRLVRTP